MERRFEEEWRKAMEGAEVQPSEEAWLAMQSALIAAENQKMKRKVVFYQRLAAASVIFALLLGALGFYSWRNNSAGKADPANLSQLNQTENDIRGSEPGTQNNDVKEQNNKLKDVSPIDKPTGAADQMTAGRRMATKKIETRRTVDRVGLLPTDSTTSERSFSPSIDPVLSNAKEEKNEQSLRRAMATKTEESPIKIQKKKDEPVQVPAVAVTTEENEKSEKKPVMYKEDLWAALSVAAGNYNSGALSAGYNNLASPPLSSGYTSMSVGGSGMTRSPVGSSYSVGLTLGKHLTRRWVILSGVNYLNQTSGYTSNSSIQGQAYLANYSTLKLASQVTYINPYPINSVLEFLSVPVQAGYLIVDRKLGLQMNAGVSTDFLLRNTLQDPSGQVNSFSQSAGSDSPYRSMNWAGLVSTELSYRMARQYRISIVPGIRYLFNPVFKSGSADHPYVTDIGFRFRYILR